MNLSDYRVTSGKQFKLSEHKADNSAGYKKADVTQEMMDENIAKMFSLQEKLYAENKQGLLIVIQAMDAAGKDGVIKHVFTGLNPQGTFVASFKQPSSEELDHDYLWRISKALPRRGEIGIFNRSHYEEVIVTRVHDLVKKQQLPEDLITKNIWAQRYAQINNFEEYLFQNGYTTIKFFLNVSKDEQRDRLLDRINEPDKNWKFSPGDIEERKHWDEYQKAYQDMIEHTSTENSPWFVVPADRKWFSRYLVSAAIVDVLEKMNPQYPQASPEVMSKLQECKNLLENG